MESIKELQAMLQANIDKAIAFAEKNTKRNSEGLTVLSTDDEGEDWMSKIYDIDGNELKVGDIVLFATNNKTISRAEIVEIDSYGVVELHTLKNRKTRVFCTELLLDFTQNK